MDKLPAELRTLTAREVEDVLCIYKDEFTRLRELREARTCAATDPIN
jgi:hypothetical protein